MAVLATNAVAQPPRPAVDIRQMPDMFHSVWPADFNGDGRIDLIAGSLSASGPATFDRVVVRLGNGNGTFGSPLRTSWTGRPVTTGDFNDDGRIDAVVVGDGGTMAILVGAGNGTFTRASALDTVADFAFAVSADVNNDGHRDLVIAGGNVVELHPGHSDLTFGPVVTLPATTHGPRSAVVADFNGDGRRDLAVAQRHGSVFVYFNRGGWRFEPSEIAIADEALYGITAADLNRDGRQDLIVTHTTEDYPAWTEGGTEVLLNTGSGTFAAPVRYLTGLPGPVTVAAGDFNRDGLGDVAVGSRSWNFDEEGPAYWDSISIFPGRGNGTLAPAAPFRLDTGLSSLLSPWVNKHHALKTADVNGDGRTDLIASPGAVVLNRAAAPNRTPVVDLGPDFTMVEGDARTLSAAIVERDWDWISVAWRDEAGRWLSDSPTAYYSGPWSGTQGSVIVTVTDVRGGVGIDRMDVRVAPGNLVLYDPPDGATYAPGSSITIRWSASLSDLDRFRILGSRDVMNTWTPIPGCEAVPADARHCVWQNAGPAANIWFLTIQALSDEGDVIGQVISGQFRIANPTDPSNWLEVFAPRSGDRFESGSAVLFQWATSQDLPPGGFRIFVSNDDFVSSRLLNDGVPAGEREFTWYNAGPAGTWRVRVEAMGDGTQVLASDTSDRFIIDPPPAGAFPWPWEPSIDIGFVGAAGSASYASGVFTVRGSGADIGGTADELHAVPTLWRGNFALTARIRSVENVNALTKAGLMIRQDVGEGSPHAAILVTPTTTNGVLFERRLARNGATTVTRGPAQTASIWLKLVKTGNTISAYYRKTITNGWTLIGRQDFTTITGALQPMLVVSSHADGRLATATFDNVTIDTLDPMQSSDIGTTVAGRTVSDGVTTTIEGNGAGISGRADGLRFRYTRWAGNGTITARVRSLEQTHALARAGVMFRESLSPGSKHVTATVSAASGITVQYRTASGGETTGTTARAGTAPEWIRLRRVGNTFTAFTSNDGFTWTTLGTATVTMGAEILVGTPVTSHTAGVLATAVFDDVMIERP